MSFGLSILDDYQFDPDFPLLESIPFEDPLPSEDHSNALLDGLIASKTASPDICVSPSELRKPSVSRWAPLNQQSLAGAQLPLGPPGPTPTPLQSSLTSPTQREASRWVPITSPTNLYPRVQTPPAQFQYPNLDSIYGQPQHLVNSGPYFGPPLPQAPIQNHFLPVNSSIHSPPMRMSPFPTPTFGRQYQPISPFSDLNAPNAEDLALSPVLGFGRNALAPAPAPIPISNPQPARKRKGSIHQSDLETSDSGPAPSPTPSDMIFTGRRPEKSRKLGPPYKHKQTEARKIVNEKRKAIYHGSKQDAQSSDEDWYSAPEASQTGNKKGRPYVHKQTKERREKNERRRQQYQAYKDDPAYKAKSQQDSKAYYENVRKFTRKNLKLVKEIQNTKEFKAAQVEESEYSDDEMSQDSDGDFMPRRSSRRSRR